MSLALVLVAVAAAPASAQLLFDYSSPATVVDDTTTALGGSSAGISLTSVARTKEGNYVLGTTGSGASVTMIDGATLELITTLAGGPATSFVVAHPNGQIYIADSAGFKLHRVETTATTLTKNLEDEPTCEPIAIAVQQTGAQDLFVSCGFLSEICPFGTDFGGAAGFISCVALGSGSVTNIAMSPDDTYVISIVDDTVYKVLTSDMTVSSVDPTTLAGVTTFLSASVFGAGIDFSQALGDTTITVPNPAEQTIIVVNKDLALLAVLPASNYGCDGAIVAATAAPNGLGDVLLACDSTTDSIIAADVEGAGTAAITSAVGLTTPTLGMSTTNLGFGLVDSSGAYVVAFFPGSGDLVLYDDTVDSGPAGVGDPLIVDVHGHSFMAGSQANRDYFLYASASGADRIEMHTGMSKGAEDGFFISELRFERAGCGALVLRAAAGSHQHKVEQEGPECMEPFVMHAGEDGVVAYLLSSGAVAVVMPHSLGEFVPGFLNIRFVGVDAAFRTGCTGMLCDESHADQLVL